MTPKELIKSMNLKPIASIVKKKKMGDQFTPNGKYVRITDCFTLCQQNQNQELTVDPGERKKLILNGFLTWGGSKPQVLWNKATS